MIQEIRKWVIYTRKEFDGIMERHGATRYTLVKDEKTAFIELDITELRSLKTFFDNWVDPYHKDNPEHSDKLK